MARPLYIVGMGGLGDCIHQRSIVRAYLAKGREVWLETPWPQIYHDLAGPRLKLVDKGSSLRTQAKNARANRAAFTRQRPPASIDVLRQNYPPAVVRSEGSVLGAMSKVAGVPVGDFRLPIPKAWREKADAWISRWKPDKPLMIYRPLVERTEWGGCAARNPDHRSYLELFMQAQEHFFVVSVADLVPGKEWTVADLAGWEPGATCHSGELDFETLAALTEMAALVFTSPGFAAVLGQAVGTPTVVVSGGYEDGTSFSAGAALTPTLAIAPINACNCFRHDHDCPKEIDMPKALAKLSDFTGHLNRSIPQPYVLGGRSKVRPNIEVTPDSDIDLSGLPKEYMNPGELETLITLVRSVKPKVMIEVGCNSGRTAKAILRNVPSLERYVGIDVPPSYEFAKSVQRREVPARPGELALDDPRFMLVLARRGTFDLRPEDLPFPDVVFIDGDHGEEAVRGDHDLALRMFCEAGGIRGEGGLIIHHDDHDEPTVDVRPTLDEISGPAAPISHVLGTWLAVQKVGG
jgi:SAM-dependent methyltransferase